MHVVGLVAHEVDELERHPGCEPGQGQDEEPGYDLGDALTSAGPGLAHAPEKAQADHEDQDQQQLAGHQGERRLHPTAGPAHRDVGQRAGKGEGGEDGGDYDQRLSHHECRPDQRRTAPRAATASTMVTAGLPLRELMVPAASNVSAHLLDRPPGRHLDDTCREVVCNRQQQR